MATFGDPDWHPYPRVRIVTEGAPIVWPSGYINPPPRPELVAEAKAFMDEYADDLRALAQIEAQERLLGET